MARVDDIGKQVNNMVVDIETLRVEVEALKTLTTALEVKIGNLEMVVGEVKASKPKKMMTEDDAKRVILGDLCVKSIKEAAIELGLTYGQIYSARNGYTFKSVHAEKGEQK